MYDLFIKKIFVNKVRHLSGIEIPISNEHKRHLILTGKNGSGKTSLLDAISNQLDFLTTKGGIEEIENAIKIHKDAIVRYQQENKSENEIAKQEQFVKTHQTKLAEAKNGIDIAFSCDENGMKAHFEKNEFIVAYYQATRKFEASIPKHVEKIVLKDCYSITENPRNEFIKYILDLKVTEALARTSNNEARANEIQNWFSNFEHLLKRIFDDDSVTMLFDEDRFTFALQQNGREPFDFNQLSDGFAAILDIVVDIMLRMQKHLNGARSFELPGIVLIDEIETHLHLELQKNVFDILTGIFPNIQFIVSTHSPFILSCAGDSVIFDLENKTLVADGLQDLPYDGIVRGYFKVDDLSKELRAKYDRYRELVGQSDITDDDMEEIASLELYLDEIPDYLALGITTEYQRLKAEFERREDF